MMYRAWSGCTACAPHINLHIYSEWMFDPWGDQHCLGCPKNHKTALSNSCRDGIHDMFKRLLSVTRMIYSGFQLEKEVGNIVPTVPTLKLFDLLIRLNHLLTQGTWQIPFARIGFDVVFIHSNKRAPLDPSPEAASYYESDLSLREGEQKKFARSRGGTNAITGKILTPDEVIGEINDANQCFIPIAIEPHGEIGSTFRRFWDGSDPFLFPPLKNHTHRLDELLFKLGLSRHSGTYWAKRTSGGKPNTAGLYLVAATSVHYPARGLNNNWV